MRLRKLKERFANVPWRDVAWGAFVLSAALAALYVVGQLLAVSVIDWSGFDD